ncbi:hypothetical protein TELCIR_13603 [Teladorsagia circumcincta]|uniref:Fucosyltransferase n=1 Tax=Teladorsagia circumcincta TaxID=45464 RepID=A0A2G9U3A5_TELCI|nr:hypothetical protein TELCIR_13603 [Teladorsagia circumcincta]
MRLRASHMLTENKGFGTKFETWGTPESPANADFELPYPDFFNMSLGFRHDTPAASPYGYTIKFAPKSRPQGELINMSLINGKTKGAAWFVSHCATNSKRELYVKELKAASTVNVKESFPVDIYGGCGHLKCARGGACESMLDKE